MLGLEVSFRLKTRVGLLSTYKFPLTCGIVRCVVSGRKRVTECIEPRGLEGPRSPVHRGTSTPSLNVIRGTCTPPPPPPPERDFEALTPPWTWFRGTCTPPPPGTWLRGTCTPPERDFEAPELPPPLNVIFRGGPIANSVHQGPEFLADGLGKVISFRIKTVFICLECCSKNLSYLVTIKNMIHCNLSSPRSCK